MGDEEEVAGPKPLKVLMVLSSVETFPEGGDAIGWYLPEVVKPYKKFIEYGWEVEFASISGTAVCDPNSVTASADDEECMAFWNDAEKKALTEAPKKLADIPVEEAVANFEAIFFVGGFAALYDFPESPEVQALIKTFYESEKVVAAVCYGTIALANVLLSDETKLLAGKTVTGFTNEETAAMGKESLVAPPTGPGTPEDIMDAAGANFKDMGKFEEHVVIDGNLFTGQNPPSAGKLAQAVIYRFDPIKAEFEPERFSLLKERALLVKDIGENKENFGKGLAPLKKQETAGQSAADKIEVLQLKATAARDHLFALLADVDSKLERNAIKRQMAVDKADAAAKAAAAEE